MHAKETELVLIYDIGQLPILERFLSGQRSGVPTLVVALDAEVDMRLREKGISFISSRDYRAKDGAQFIQPEEGLAFLDGSTWSWFSYRNISLGQLFSPTLQGYIRQVMYYTGIIARICDAQQRIGRMTVLAPVQEIPQAGAYIAKREISVVSDCARLVGERRGIEVMMYEPRRVRERLHARTRLFFLQQAFFSWGFVLLNFCTNRLRPRGTLRIVASDYWRNIAPVLSNLPGAEVILLDRKQVLNARLRNAWRYRMRFINQDAYAPRAEDAPRAEALRALGEKWKEARRSIPDNLHVENISLRPFLDELLEEVMREWLPGILEKIDELYALMDALRPDIVLLRATVSQQWHFPLLALIATARGIPSLELLHGMEYVGPGSLDKRHVAQYLGVYGTHTQRQMLRIGFTASRVPIIGSPRFDPYELEKYAQIRKERRETSGHLSVFCTAPDLFIGGTFDTYDIEDYFFSVARALQKIPDVSTLIKLRPGPYRETFYRQAIAQAFKDIPYTIAQYEPLRELFSKVDLAISCQSTVTLEALQCGVPLALFAATPVERLMLRHNFADAAAEGAVALCQDTESLSATVQELAADTQKRKKLSAAAETYLNREFSFDGRGAERAAVFIRTVTERG